MFASDENHGDSNGKAMTTKESVTGNIRKCQGGTIKLSAGLRNPKNIILKKLISIEKDKTILTPYNQL